MVQKFNKIFFYSAILLLESFHSFYADARYILNRQSTKTRQTRSLDAYQTNPHAALRQNLLSRQEMSLNELMHLLSLLKAFSIAKRKKYPDTWLLREG